MEERTIMFWLENRVYIQKLKLNAQNMAEFYQFVGFPPNPFNDHRWFMITSDPLLLATHQVDLVFGPFALSQYCKNVHMPLDLAFSKLLPTEGVNSKPSNVFHLENLLLVEPIREKRAEETEESFTSSMCGANDFIIIKKHDSNPIYLVKTKNEVKPYIEMHTDKICYPVMTIISEGYLSTLGLTLNWNLPYKRPFINLSPLNVTGVLPMMKEVMLGVITSLKSSNKRLQCNKKLIITYDEDLPTNLKSIFDDFGEIANWVNVTKDGKNWVEVTYETSEAASDAIVKSKADNGIGYEKQKVYCLEDCGRRAESEKRAKSEAEDDATAPKRARTSQSSSTQTEDPRAEIEHESVTPNLQRLELEACHQARVA